VHLYIWVHAKQEGTDLDARGFKTQSTIL